MRVMSNNPILATVSCGILAAGCLAIPFTKVYCEPNKGVEIDSAFLSISQDELKQRIETSRSEIDLVELCDRAERHGLLSTAQDTLKQLADAHPKSVLYLGAYWYSIKYAGSPELASEYVSTRKKLIDLKAFDTNYWLPLILEGVREVHSSRDHDGQSDGMAKLRRATKLAPNVSMTHLYLASGYLDEATSTWNGRSFGPNYNRDMQSGFHEVTLADKLEPVACEVLNKKIWFDVFYLKSNEKARQDKKRFLAMASDQSLLFDREKAILSVVK